MCLVTRPVFAQGVGGVTAVANVSAMVQQPLDAAKTNDLDFETVIAGTNKSIDVMSSKAASFVIHGSPNCEIHLAFTLPASLTNGSSVLLISDWVGRHNTSGMQGSGIDFTPSAAPTTITLGASGVLYVYLGATVEPTVDQAPGTYTGTITLTVEYF
jgi:hypothetical protein